MCFSTTLQNLNVYLIIFDSSYHKHLASKSKFFSLTLISITGYRVYLFRLVYYDRW